MLPASKPPGLHFVGSGLFNHVQTYGHTQTNAVSSSAFRPPHNKPHLSVPYCAHAAQTQSPQQLRRQQHQEQMHGSNPGAYELRSAPSKPGQGDRPSAGARAAAGKAVRRRQASGAGQQSQWGSRLQQQDKERRVLQGLPAEVSPQ